MGADDAGAGAHLAVLERGVGPDHGVLGDDRRAEQLHARQDRDVGVELDVGVDPGGRGVHHGDALAHPPVHDAPVELLAHLGQLGAVVGPLGLPHVVDGERADGEAVLASDLDGVGQVVLALGVVVGQPRQRADQELRVEGEDPRADLGDLALLRRGVLLLHDPLDVTLVVAQDPPVAERVGHDPAEDAHHLLGGPVVGHEPAQALALEQRGVARRHDDRAARRTAGPHRHPHGPAGPVEHLLDRQHGVRHQLLDVRPDLLALVADHRDDTVRLDRPDGGQHVPDHAAATDVVEHLHRLALHPGAATGRQDNDGQLVSFAHAPRVGVEPTSLVLIQSQAGPTGRPTGD